MENNIHSSAYKLLVAMAILHFLAMYVLMYSMVDVWANVFPNLNQFYMAGLMTMPMIIFEIFLMGTMYPNKKKNLGIVITGVFLLILFFVLIRQQTAISDEQFLKSMIPHHAGAILMCEKASLEDPEIIELCQSIIAGQQAEIDFMKSKLIEVNK